MYNIKYYQREILESVITSLVDSGHWSCDHGGGRISRSMKILQTLDTNVGQLVFFFFTVLESCPRFVCLFLFCSVCVIKNMIIKVMHTHTRFVIVREYTSNHTYTSFFPIRCAMGHGSDGNVFGVVFLKCVVFIQESKFSRV